MPKYELQYFDIRGRAEIMRLLFAEAGIKYTDTRFTGEQWKAEKPNTPFGQLPVLYIIDGAERKPLAQSGAITRYLAREFGLAGTNSIQTAYIDMLMESLGGAFEKLPYFVQDPAEKEKKMKDAFENHVCPTLKVIENKLKDLGGDYMIGKKFSAIDIILANATSELSNFKEDLMCAYPCLLALQKRVLDRPNIKEWIAKRPKSSY